jgi:hypothetical protein
METNIKQQWLKALKNSQFISTMTLGQMDEFPDLGMVIDSIVFDRQAMSHIINHESSNKDSMA